MKAEDQKKLNNLYRRYQNYDNDGVKYAYDIYFDTLTGERQLKAKRHTGVEKFREHIEELMEHFSDVSSITVTDYAGKNQRSKEMNPPVTIYLLDVKNMDTTPKIIVHGTANALPPEDSRSAGDNILQGLSGLFAGTEYAGLGNIAPIAKFIDDKHVIDRLREKNEEQKREIEELKRQNGEWRQKYETLNGSFEDLREEADDMEDELSGFRERERNRAGWASMLGLAGAGIVKNLIRQNPKILSGIIPADQLAGFLSDDEPAAIPQTESTQTAEEKEKIDDATVVFEWLQTLDASTFAKVITVIAAMRQNGDYTDRILAFLNGNKNLTVRG